MIMDPAHPRKLILERSEMGTPLNAVNMIYTLDHRRTRGIFPFT